MQQFGGYLGGRVYSHWLYVVLPFPCATYTNQYIVGPRAIVAHPPELIVDAIAPVGTSSRSQAATASGEGFNNGPLHLSCKAVVAST